MKKLYVLASILAASFGCVGTSFSQTAPNSTFDDYAPAFRQLPGGGAELWFTSVLSSKSGRNRQMMVSRCTKDGFDTPAPLDDANINFIDPVRSAANGVLLNGVPSFRCDGTYGVFVSNRLVNGKDYGNDIYEMCLSSNGHWQVRRIDEVDSDSWDDTPSLSADGNTLYFSSDRRNPGRKHTELFYSRRLASGSWSPAAPIDVLDDAPGNHEAPCAGPDGFFYFSTNDSGRYQIWRSPMKDGLPTNNGEPVSFGGLNSTTSDQTDPTFSPGGNWMLFTSNRADSGRTKDQDIYWVRTNSKPLTLSVNVQQRVRRSDPADPTYTYDATQPLSTSVNFQVQSGGASLIERSDAKGNCLFTLPPASTPAADLTLKVGLLYALPPSSQFVSATDTLIYIQDSKKNFDRTLIVWDTSSYYDPSCKQTFPIADVRFFIEGYWGPTTYKYRNFIQQRDGPKCPSFFSDTTCIIADKKCDDNNLYSFKYLATRQEAYPECFNYKEFRTFGKEYADEVDARLDTLKADMQTALTRDCVVRAKRQHKKIEVRVTGYTDPKKYKDPECEYNGENVDFSKEAVHLFERRKVSETMDTDIARQDVEETFKTGTLMLKLGGGGNPLLSWLRAYWAAVLLDSIWNSSVQAYKELRDSGLLVIKAEGKSVNPDEKRTFAARRSIEVEVSTETNEIFHQGMRPKPGQVVELWNQCEPESASPCK